MTRPTDVARSAAAVAFGVVRRGPRTVLWTPTVQMGLGNFLYFWLWAHERRALGREDVVLVQPKMTPWLEHFPAVSELVTERGGVRLTDRREIHWNQHFGRDFSKTTLQDFLRARILSAPAFSAASGLDGAGVVVINIRRGDYYSNFKFRGQYGFDVESYLRIALAEASASAPLTRVHVVSDGLDWCRARLGWIGDLAGSLTFEDDTPDPIRDFVTLATARRLVLTNSTFSYWAGYASNALHANEGQVWAPWFHARHLWRGEAFQLDPDWRIVPTIPGGWDS